MGTQIHSESGSSNLPAPIIGTATMQTSETASSAVAAQAKASIEAKYLMAMHNPRSWADARVRMLEACKRPVFAETAMYAKPVGGKEVVGPSIRFVEEALRASRNVLAESAVVFDDHEKRIVRVTVTDLEANLSYPMDILIEKTVERKQPKKGDDIIRQRLNSKNEVVYIIAAGEDALLVKQAALTSKAIRTCGLRLIPSDIVEEAIDQVNATLRDRDAKDPTAAKKRVIDAFYSVGVMPSQLDTYLGHSVEQATPAEIGQLRRVFQALKDGEATWTAVMEERNGGGSTAEAKPTKAGADGLKAALKKEPVAQGAAPSAPELSDAEIASIDEERERKAREVAARHGGR